MSASIHGGEMVIIQRDYIFTAPSSNDIEYTTEELIFRNNGNLILK